MAETKQHSHLTLIKGGKLTEQEFMRLPIPEKISALRQQPVRKRFDLILADPDGITLARELQPQELYWMVRELGEEDSLELFEIVSPEQYSFMLDMELWEKWSFSQGKALKWIGYLVDAGEEKVVGQLPHLDLEMLLLLLKGQIAVAGGLGDLVNDEQRLANWDHSFDNIYYITFTQPKNARLTGTVLDIIYRHDAPLYQALMVGVQNEMESELEELCWQFRTGRLADLGFPSIDEALSIYAWRDPATFTPAKDKLLMKSGETENVPEPLPMADQLLRQALALADSPELQLEINYLINNALVAEETAFADEEEMEAVCRRVYGYLNTALEFLAGADEQKGAEILRGEHFTNLFQLGHSLVARLKKQAGALTSDNYAVNKALIGLKAKRPNYYRGLDADRADGYREFRGMADVRAMEEFLRALEV